MLIFWIPAPWLVVALCTVAEYHGEMYLFLPTLSCCEVNSMWYFQVSAFGWLGCCALLLEPGSFLLKTVSGKTIALHLSMGLGLWDLNDTCAKDPFLFPVPPLPLLGSVIGGPSCRFIPWLAWYRFCKATVSVSFPSSSESFISLDLIFIANEVFCYYWMAYPILLAVSHLTA